MPAVSIALLNCNALQHIPIARSPIEIDVPFNGHNIAFDKRMGNSQPRHNNSARFRDYVDVGHVKRCGLRYSPVRLETIGTFGHIPIR